MKKLMLVFCLFFFIGAFPFVHLLTLPARQNIHRIISWHGLHRHWKSSASDTGITYHQR